MLQLLQWCCCCESKDRTWEARVSGSLSFSDLEMFVFRSQIMFVWHTGEAALAAPAPTYLRAESQHCSSFLTHLRVPGVGHGMPTSKRKNIQIWQTDLYCDLYWEYLSPLGALGSFEVFCLSMPYLWVCEKYCKDFFFFVEQNLKNRNKSSLSWRRIRPLYLKSVVHYTHSVNTTRLFA